MFNAPQNIGHGPTCKSEDFIPFYNLEIEQNAIGEPKFSMLNVQWNTVDSLYIEVEGTLCNTSRYPYFDISDVQY